MEEANDCINQSIIPIVIDAVNVLVAVAAEGKPT